MSKDLTQNTAALKTLVGVLTGLLLLGMVLLVVGMLRTVDDLDGETTELRLPVPAGHRLEEASLSGERLLLRFRGQEDGVARILVLDLKNGRPLADIQLAPAP